MRHQENPPVLYWFSSKIDHFTPLDHWAALKESSAPYQGYVLLIAGCSSHRPGKRWPAACYGALATALVAQGLLPVLIGTPADRSVMDQVCDICPQVYDLCGLTTLPQLACLARGARYAVANDTGPAHIAAMVGCPILVLFSNQSNPVFSAPQGE